MSLYLVTLLAQASGATAQVRLRPKARFEGECASVTIDELPLPPSVDVPGTAAPSIAPLQQPQPGPRTVEPAAPGSAAAANPVSSQQLRERQYDSIRERIETRQHSEHLVERQERVVERHAHSAHSERIIAQETAVSVPAASAPPTVEPPPIVPGISVMTVATASPPFSSRQHVREAGAPSLPSTVSPRRRSRAVPAEPTITVSIGRLDIRLTPATAPARRAAEPASAPLADNTPSLDEYLQRRMRGQA
jgi:hypothetical protein